MSGGYRYYNPSVFALLRQPLVPSNRQVYEDLGTLVFADYTKDFTESFD
jgi:hypothetical protein